MKKSTLRRADLVFSYILMIIAVYIMIESIVLFFNPFGRDFELVQGDTIKRTIETWYESPALMPFLLSFIILYLAFALKKVAIKDGAKLDFITLENFKKFINLRETKVATIIIAILSLYVFVLIPVCRSTLNFFPKFQGFPFMIATFISMSLQMVIFNKKTPKAMLTSLLVAAIASAAITYGFGVLALIPLP